MNFTIKFLRILSIVHEYSKAAIADVSCFHQLGACGTNDPKGHLLMKNKSNGPEFLRIPLKPFALTLPR